MADAGLPPDGPMADGLVGNDSAQAACATICPRLFTLAVECERTGTCTYQSTAMGANYCFPNGTKNYVTSGISGSRFNVSTRFTKPDGTICYTIETSAELSGGDQTLVWKDPAGATIATGVASGAASITLRCDGVEHEVSGMSCPGTRYGAPADCMEGGCQ